MSVMCKVICGFMEVICQVQGGYLSVLEGHLGGPETRVNQVGGSDRWVGRSCGCVCQVCRWFRWVRKVGQVGRSGRFGLEGSKFRTVSQSVSE